VRKIKEVRRLKFELAWGCGRSPEGGTPFAFIPESNSPSPGLPTGLYQSDLEARNALRFHRIRPVMQSFKVKFVHRTKPLAIRRSEYGQT
jgi:hypothetical protein